MFPFANHIGRYCHISKLKQFYICLFLAIPLIYIYISISVVVSNIVTINSDEYNLYPFQDYYENKNYHKFGKQRHGEPIKLSKIRKFILMWNWANDKSFHNIPEGNEIFTKNKCRYHNCFLTGSKNMFSDIRYFHAIAFGPATTNIVANNLPEQRSLYQKYIFYSKEPPQMNPACDEHFDNFFNWTWTYKLDSNIRWGLVIRDSNDTVVGPKQNMKWISTNTSSVRNNKENESEDKKRIAKKYLAAAWIPSGEWSFNSREKLVAQLRVALKDLDLNLDLIGKRGRQCVENNANVTCDDILEDFYYFYLAFEKATTEDYVTNILLHALQHNVVPIVYGGADYTRFLPPGSYINANSLSPERLAEKIASLIQDNQKYLKYFEWRKHYSYHDTYNRTDTNEYCQLCALLNKESFLNTSVYENFHTWWNSSECKSETATFNESDEIIIATKKYRS